MNFINSRRKVALLGIAVFGAVPLSVSALSFTITDLGTLGGDTHNVFSVATAINDSGQIVGQSSYDGGGAYDPHAFLWDGGTMTDLGTLGGDSSTATDINNSGQIVGQSRITPGETDGHAFLWDGGTMTSLNISSDDNSAAYGINENGQVVGYGINGGEGQGINDSGQFVSAIGTFDGGHHASLHDGGTVTDLGSLGGKHSVGRGINNSGQVVGESAFSYGSDWTHRRAFLWDEGTMTDLGTLAGHNQSHAANINNNGQIVGWSFTSNSPYRAFLYDDTLGGMLDLNDFIDPLSGWQLTHAHDINNKGQIVGMGIINGEARAFLLTSEATPPVPEPATMTLLGLGLVGLAVRSRRNKV